MVSSKSFLILELVIIFVYLFMVLSSIVILPVKLFLGIICVLFIPGYNLLNLIKPRAKLIEKLGYTTILSLAIENIYMFFYYFLLYENIATNQGFIFDPILLIFSIQVINIALVYTNLFKVVKNRSYKTKKQQKIDFKSIIGIFDKTFLLIYVGFFLSLLLLCISATFSYVPNNNFSIVHEDYRSNFTFFYRVHFTFFIFMAMSIFFLVFIVLNSNNKYLILISISIFMYCLWILPYLQINNNFSEDAHHLLNAYNNYLEYGIAPNEQYVGVKKKEGKFMYPSNFSIRGIGPLRYSTSLFTAIILTSATGVDIKFTLWYLYPLIFIFSPFFFYSIFQNFSKNDEKECQLGLVILTILSMFTTQFLKSAHSATTMVLGAYIFLILVIEFYNLMHERKFKFKIMKFLLIVFLYFFLCLTHFEESIYFIFIVVLYCIYFLFFQIKKIDLFNVSHKKSFNRISNRHAGTIFKTRKYDPSVKKTISYLKGTLFMVGILIVALLLIFYLTQEFIGYTLFFLKQNLEDNSFFEKIILFYENTKGLRTPFFKSSFLISLFVILIIIFSVILWTVILFLIFFKFYSLPLRIYEGIIVYIKKIFNILKKIISLKIFQILIFPLFLGVILFINWVYYSFLQEQGFLLVVELLLNYTIIICHIFLFFKGITYYEIENDKQNYFL